MAVGPSASRSLVLTAALVLLASAIPAAAVAAAPAGAPRAGDPIPGRVVVRFAAGASSAQRGAARQAIDAAGAGAARPSTAIPGLEILATRLPVDVAVNRLQGRPGVLYAEPDRYIAAEAAPNDPGYATQWGLENAGDHDIDAEAAWTITKGSPDVVVAIIDTGIQLDHPDLAANIWTNTAEIAGNGIDDDDNGLIDDRRGWDFYDGDANPTDENGHGTHVAGIVAARQDNGIGVSGVAPLSRLMALRVLGADGFGSISAGVAAVEYAWRNGARIANLSWGWTGGVSQQLLDAIDIAGAHGMTVVTAAGNESADTDGVGHYPSAYPSTNLLSVAATDQADALWAGSNRGAATVDLGAPGASVLSTYLGATAGGGAYATLTGTSMAAPHVAGVAALLLAANPTWTVSQVRIRLFQSVRPLPSLAGKTATGGLVNAAAALAGTADRPPAVTITAPGPGSAVLPGTAVTFSATASDLEDGNVGASLAWRSSLQGALGTGPTITTSNLSVGHHVITAMAVDSVGHKPIRSLLIDVGPTVTRIAGSTSDGQPSIAVTPAGSPTIAWRRSGAGIYVASPGAGTTWPSVLAVPSSDDRSVDLTIGADGLLRAAVERSWSSISVYSDPGILLAEKQGGVWKTQRLSDSCQDGNAGCLKDQEPDAVVDAAGLTHVIVARTFPTFGAGAGQPAIVHLWRTTTGAPASEVVHTATWPAMPSLAIGTNGAIHVAWVELAGDTPGIWYATNATGAWISTRLSPDGGALDARVAVTAGGVVRVLARTAAGIWLRSRTGATWSSPSSAVVLAGTFGRLDLAQDSNGKLHVALERSVASQSGGITYATDASGTWTARTLTANQAIEPSIAVDGSGHPHIAFSMYGNDPAITYATNASGSWVLRSVVGLSALEAAGYAVDGRGVAQAAVTRYGSAPGVYLGQRSGASWSLARITSNLSDGGLGFAVSSTGEAHLLYGTSFKVGGGRVADPSILYATNASGAWKTTRLGPNAGTSLRGLVLDPGGKVHVVFRGTIGGRRGIVYATNRSGAWKSTLVRIGDEIDPTLAIDSAGRIRIATRLVVGTQSRIETISNVSGAWQTTTVSSGGWDQDPAIAIDPDGETSIAYWRNGVGGLGVRLTEQRGSTWATRLIQTGTVPIRPQLRIDSTGVRHVLYGDASADYAICDVPLCPLYPGLREAVGGDTGPFSVNRVTFTGSDLATALDRGRDGSLGGVFTRTEVGVYEVVLERPFARVATTIDDLSPMAVPKSGPRLLSGRLHAGATNLAGRTLVFKVDGVQVGSATTAANGVASFSWTAAAAPGVHTLTIGYSGGAPYRAARLGPRPLTVQG